jgi:uncharacterized protein (DUF433 family)
MTPMSPEAADLIAVDPQAVHGRGQVRGTRIPASVVLDYLAAGMREVAITEEYPTLTAEGIRAAAVGGAGLAREEIQDLPIQAS